MWIAIGIALSAGIGTMIDNPVLGVGIGVALGAAIGGAVAAYKKQHPGSSDHQ